MSPALSLARPFIPRPACGEPDGFRVELAGRGAWASGDNPAVLRVRCLGGAAWVTQAGDGRDVVLRPGEEFVAAPRGKVVVQALSEAVVVWVAPRGPTRRTPTRPGQAGRDAPFSLERKETMCVTSQLDSDVYPSPRPSPTRGEGETRNASARPGFDEVPA